MLVIKSDNVETRFLSEAELPSFARHNQDTSGDTMETQESLPTTSSSSSDKPNSMEFYKAYFGSLLPKLYK
jgi:hypothetical protein